MHLDGKKIAQMRTLQPKRRLYVNCYKSKVFIKRTKLEGICVKYEEKKTLLDSDISISLNDVRPDKR